MPVKLVCATWLLTIWYPNLKPKSVCLRENTALGRHLPQQMRVLQRPGKQLLSYDIIPNERFCVLSRVIIWPFESRPWPTSGMRKLLLLINSDTTMSTSADLVKKKKKSPPLLSKTAPFSVITLEISLPNRDVSRDWTARFKGRCISCISRLV